MIKEEYRKEVTPVALPWYTFGTPETEGYGVGWGDGEGDAMPYVKYESDSDSEPNSHRRPPSAWTFWLGGFFVGFFLGVILAFLLGLVQ